MSGNHQFLIGFHHADCNRTAVAADYFGIGLIKTGIEFNAQEFHPLADPPADGGGIRADSGRKDQRI